jgi:tetratricopeptide (TPR) repeat protein
MRSRWALLFVLMQIAGFSGAATAQNVDQQQCIASDPDLSISRCTAMIQTGHNLAVAFSSRGTAYARKGQYDRAIEDLDQAIRLNPNDAVAFDNRGATYRRAYASIDSFPLHRRFWADDRARMAENGSVMSTGA